MKYFGEPTQAILEFFAASVDRLVCYTAVFSGKERCVTTLRTAVYETMNDLLPFFLKVTSPGRTMQHFLLTALLFDSVETVQLTLKWSTI